MAARIVESTDINPAPLHVVLGSAARAATLKRLKERVAEYASQTERAASADISDGSGA